MYASPPRSRPPHALLTRSRHLAQQIPLLAQPTRPLAASHAAGAQSIYFEEDGALAGAVSQTVVVAPRPSRRGAVRSAAAALLAAYRRYEAYLLTLGVVFFYLAFTIIQENVFKQRGFRFGGFFTALQSFIYFGISQLRYVLGRQRRVPAVNGAEESKQEGGTDEEQSQERHEAASVLSLKTQWFFVQCGFYNVAGIALANYSVNYLNYATYILLRSSRVVATMIGGIFILGKRFMAIEYLGVLLVTAGMVVFSSGDVKAAKAGTEFSSLIIGVVLNIGSLAMNSFQDNYQEKGLHAMRLSENDMIRFTYAYGTLLLVPVLLVNGELVAAIRFLVANPDLIFLILLSCVLTYLGLVCITLLVQRTNAVFVGIVTTVRKAFSVIFSFLLFGKPLTMFHFVGGFTVFGGIALHQSAKAMKAKQRQRAAHAELREVKEVRDTQHGTEAERAPNGTEADTAPRQSG